MHELCRPQCESFISEPQKGARVTWSGETRSLEKLAKNEKDIKKMIENWFFFYYVCYLCELLCCFLHLIPSTLWSGVLDSRSKI